MRNAVGRMTGVIPAAMSPFLAPMLATPAHSADQIALSPSALPAIAAVSAVIAGLSVIVWTILTSRRLRGASLFNRLFIVVAVSSGFFSAVSSAIGFALITSQENDDLLRNSVLPPAFGFFVFFLAVAIWVGGAELVRHRDWFRHLGKGLVGDAAFFVERCLKLFVVIPVLAVILFFVSTWTTVVGIGGVDAVRHAYLYEIGRLQGECAGIATYRQKDFVFLRDLRLAVDDLARAARTERETGAQSGSAGAGAVSSYFDGLSAWTATLGAAVEEIIVSPDPSGVDPYDPSICTARVEALNALLSSNAHENYDRWAREFETAFNDFAGVLNRWRQDRRIVSLMDAQLDNFYRANPKPAPARLSAAQRAAIDRYADEVETALSSLVRSQKLAKPPAPIRSYAELYPARGLAIFNEIVAPPAPPAEDERVSRRLEVVMAEFVPNLSTLSPRDAVLKNANVFSDIWALSIAWDYAAYILMLAYLFFPSAERAAGFKDARPSVGRSFVARLLGRRGNAASEEA